MSMGVFVLRCG